MKDTMIGGVSSALQEALTIPFDNSALLRKQKSLRRKLLTREGVRYIDKKIAILGGATTADFKNLLEIFLLASGIRPSFYESEYNKYYEDSVFPNALLDSFTPDIIFIFTGIANLIYPPDITDDEHAVQKKLKAEYRRYETMWDSLTAKYSAVIIQNNFDPPYFQPEGNLDASLPQGVSRFVARLNEKFAAYAATHDNFYLHDQARVAMEVGLSNWHNRNQYYAYKLPMNYDVIPDVAWSAARLIRSILGKTKKVLVLDLDNTLWGGVIGDDGLQGIELGHETPQGEAFLEWQHYVKHLKSRGVLLAVCSKNEEATAKEGFSHPDSILQLVDFVSFLANWEPKDTNLRRIAEELNLGLDSFVFVDDNPAERALIRQSLPEVAVPDIDPAEVFSYIRAIEGNGYFDTAALSADDFRRNQAYRENQARQTLEKQSINYDDFLQSLHMEAEVGKFQDIYYDRIAQLTNKTNQFNLTTLRCTRADIERIARAENYIALYCRLKDAFGDNGLISIVIAEIQNKEAHIRLWLMSCRVLKRGVEDLMLDAVMVQAAKAGLKTVVGYYYPTAKNKMVENLYKDFGFALREETESGTVWEMPVAGYEKKNRFIDVRENGK